MKLWCMYCGQTGIIWHVRYTTEQTHLRTTRFQLRTQQLVWLFIIVVYIVLLGTHLSSCNHFAHIELNDKQLIMTFKKGK